MAETDRQEVAATVDQAMRDVIAALERSRTVVCVPGAAVDALTDAVEGLASVVNALMWRDTIGTEYAAIRRALAEFVNVYSAQGQTHDQRETGLYRVFLSAVAALGFALPKRTQPPTDTQGTE